MNHALLHTMAKFNLMCFTSFKLFDNKCSNNKVKHFSVTCPIYIYILTCSVHQFKYFQIKVLWFYIKCVISCL